MTSNKNIVTAETAGFCWGVKRAMDMTLETAHKSDGPVFTHGPLIHNPQVIEMLEEKQVFAVENAASVDEGRVIIRTHGITPQVRKDLRERGLAVSDATCPLVAKVQGIIKKHASRGFSIVIIGDQGHAEVTGLMGYAKGDCHVISTEDEAIALPQMDKVCVVAQTTCDTGKYDQIIDILQNRYPSSVIMNTICEATQERQQEARNIASQVDLMVVVGGRNSANTNRLAQLARAEGTSTILIESEDELDPDSILTHGTIGLTAGASTPSWMIQRVRDRLEAIVDHRSLSLFEKIKSVLSLMVIGNVSLALGAALLTLANSMLAGYAFSWVSAFIASAYLFSMYALNQLNDVQSFKHNEPKKIKFYLKWQNTIKITSLIATLLSIMAAFYLGPLVFAIYIASLVLGLAYTVKWFPEIDWLPVHRLKDIPASKDVFVGVAWSWVTAVMPAIGAGADPFALPVIVTGFYTFGLVYIRSTLSDIRDIHGDKLVGRETIPILIGKNPTKVFLGVLTVLITVLLAASTAMGWTTSFAYLFLLTAPYTALYLWLYHMRIISRGIRLDLVLDGVFHLAGLLATIWLLSGASAI